MASAQNSDKLATTLKVTKYDFDPDSGAAVDVAWVDMQNFDKIMVLFFRTIGTGALDTFDILANSASDGSGTDVIIKTHAVANEPNAVGDYIYLECTAEEIGALSTATNQLRYVTVSAEFATTTDEGVVTYIRDAGRFAHDALTVELIA